MDDARRCAERTEDTRGRLALTRVSGTHALIFVLDSSDTARMDEAKSELGRIIQDREMRNVVLLVFANKQDLSGGENGMNTMQSETVTDECL